MKPFFPLFLLVSGGLLNLELEAALSLPQFFSDHMVLQRDRAAAVWGQADPNASVSITFKGNSASATADDKGFWRASINTGKADVQGAELVISSGAEQKKITDVLVGEVWLASGQSNMAYTCKSMQGAGAGQLITKTDIPGVRMFLAPAVTAPGPQRDIQGAWSVCSEQTLPQFSAVAFFFAQKLHEELQVPIGILKTAWGGKPVETFTSAEALNTLPATKELVDAMLHSETSYNPDAAQKAYDTAVAKWKAATNAQKNQPEAERKKLPKKPDAPKRPIEKEGNPGTLFNSMIHPFVGYSLRGAIWYQGEANAHPGKVPYDQTLPLMIGDWRKRWEHEFPFYFVQLANFKAPSTAAGTPDGWALLQDRMRLVLTSTPKTGMAIINDVGEADNIHPKDKKTPGERLALWALAKDYGRDLVYSGPLYKGYKVEGEAIRVDFEQAGKGLKSRDGGPLKRFEIAGDDHIWRWAEARIDGNASVLVSCAEVKQPVAVRYAWASNPAGANLVNSEGLPTSVFRTDNWNDVERFEERKPSRTEPAAE